MGMRGYLMAIDEFRGAAAKAGKLDVGALATGAHEIVWSEQDPSEHGICFVGKLWHALHYLFAGSAWQPSPGLGELFMGGTEVGDDLGYGPARYHGPAAVRGFGESLGGLHDDALRDRFSTHALDREDIYPNIWGEPEDELWQELAHHLTGLRTLVDDASTRGSGLLVFVM